MNYSYTRFGLTAVVSILAASALLAQTVTVTSAADSGPGTLRDAVINSAAATIRFDASLDGATITLATPITVTRDIDFRGNGEASTVLSGGLGAFRITGGTSKFYNLAIVSSANRNGGAIGAFDADVFVFDCRFERNFGGGGLTEGGGAIYGTGGTIYAQNSSFIRNTANEPSGSGGAIYAGPGAALRVLECSFDANFASRAGGAIEDASGEGFTSAIDGNVFTNNVAPFNPGNGGAIHISGDGDMNITNSTATRNAAREGGAFWNDSGEMMVNSCIIRNNVAVGADPDQGGGGIFSEGGKLLVVGSTQITRNRASGLGGSGGGIFVNTAATLEVYGAFFAENTSTRAGAGVEDNSGPTTETKFGDVTFANNSTHGRGGAYHMTGDGRVRFTNGSVNDNAAFSEGGGLRNGTGDMLILGTAITGNSTRGTELAQGGGGIYNAGGTLSIKNGAVISGNRSGGFGGSGGGIFNAAGGSLDISNATMNGNATTRAGGAIEDQSGPGLGVKVFNVSFTGNYAAEAPGNGGAIHVTGPGDIQVARSSFDQNFATREGGALWNDTGFMRLLNVEVTNNRGLGTEANQGGGGLFNNGGTVVIASGSSFTGNSAPRGSGSGGGILNNTGGTLTIFGGTIADNTARRAGGGIEDVSGSGTTLQLYNVILSGNATGNAPGNGGALHVTGDGDVVCKGGTVQDNTAASEGGGFWNGTGAMLIGEVDFRGNVADGDGADNGGGAIFNLGGTLEVTSESRFIGNLATGISGSGGAILSQGPLRIEDATFVNNSASRAGGAIEDNSSTTVVIEDVTFADNSTAANPGNGGAIHITGASAVSINDSDFNDNFAAAEGGGFWNGSGAATVSNSTFRRNTAEGNDADQGGGAVFTAGGVLDLDRVLLLENNAFGANGSGGGVLYDAGSSGTISNSRIDGNVAVRAGGGVEHNGGAGNSVTVTGSNLINNVTGSAPGNGGAFHTTGGGNSRINTSTVTANTAANEGGALWNGTGQMIVQLSDVSGNNVTGGSGGGGLFNAGGEMIIQRTLVSANESTGGAAIGGGIHNANPGRLTVNYSTISGNTSASDAGGIANVGAVAVNASTIALNQAATNGGGIGQAAGASQTVLRSTIVALNTATDRGDDLSLDAGTFVTQGYNAIGSDESGAFNGNATDKEGTAARPLVLNLQPLADNGGPTMTHAVTCGSVAIDMGDPSLTREDQRSFTLNGRRDIGSFEQQTSCPDPVAAVTAPMQTFSVYPTSARDNVTVELTAEGTDAKSADEMYTYRIVSASGVTVRELESASERIDVNVGGLTPGMYYVQRISAAGIESEGFQILR